MLFLTPHEARHHAVKALKKMEEPKTEAEIQALIERTRQAATDEQTVNQLAQHLLELVDKLVKHF
ncbi:hypothetical protein KKI93_10005 [Xenorhabdus bovienii]|uniref:Uncharacterized protein n=1 Tax=Xenorhabdus bovienii str. Intermedium TaxID=1379677 RepID=A0A077QC88_XENBV|nr:hypothetical protein [Xenorhabdus bovienii]MDE9544644.1 hypothetical protein [Xenorhabdus bovienii]MDE9564393.1 hypothetical protein [Xenorhabdus bovienii]CDH33792.1 hypothetical protein XBI1_280008 [Xenorhabdus bovienii str. Intermedium]